MAIAFFIQASAIGTQAFLIREYKGVGTALLGNLSIATGFMLVILREQLPLLIGVVIGNTLIVSGAVLFFIAVGRFTEVKYSRGLAYTIVTITFLSLYYFSYVNNQIQTRIIIVSLAGAISSFAIVYKLWASRNVPYRFSIVITCIPFLTYGMFLVTRSIITYFYPPKTLFSNSPIESATYLILFVISFLWTIGFTLMVSQRLQLDLTEMATTDLLTRIPNRRAAQSFLEKELARATRQQSEFSVLVIDMDNLKVINDTHGHDTGDYSLVMLAHTIESIIRKQDFVGRWGGDEFLVILPDTPIENAYILAERIRTDISTAHFKHSTATIKITVSGGIASSKHAGTVDKLLKKADDALYTAKAAKDTVVPAK